MEKIDARKLKKQLRLSDYDAILRGIGIPIHSKSKTQWTCWTGDKNVDPMKGSPKLIFYVDTGVFVSYTASRSYDIIGLVQQRLSILKQPCGFLDAVNKIVSITGVDMGRVVRISQSRYAYNWEENLERYVRFKNTGSVLNKYDSRILDDFEPYYPASWIDEGITQRALEKYRIGYYAGGNATTIPCFDERGELIGIRVRNWNWADIEAKRKYMPLMLLDGTCFKFNTNNVFYGINFNKPNIENSGEIILVESEKSVLMADSIYGDKSNVVALYGSQLGSIRRNQIIKMGVSRVVIALDSDFHVNEYTDSEYVEFEKKILRFAQQFRGFCRVDVVYNNLGLDGYKYSPFDFGKEDYLRLYEARENII